MLAKVVSFGKTRDDSIKNLEKALTNTIIVGINTNVNFLLNCTKTFIKDNYSTKFIDETEKEREILKKEDLPLEQAILLTSKTVSDNDSLYPLNGFRLNLENVSNLKIEHDKIIYNISIHTDKFFKKKFFINSKTHSLIKNTAKAFKVDDKIYVKSKYKSFEFKIINEIEISTNQKIDNKLTAPMNATVSKILIKNNEIVEEGQLLIILEAMKMELEVKSPYSGIVKKIECQVTSQVTEGQKLIEIEENE
jgi:acetyl/propionyl-CoA carboxylase alpha subunit